MSLYNYKGEQTSFIVKKRFIETGFKEVWVVKGFCNLFVFGNFVTIMKGNYDLL